MSNEPKEGYPEAASAPWHVSSKSQPISETTWRRIFYGLTFAVCFLLFALCFCLIQTCVRYDPDFDAFAKKYPVSYTQHSTEGYLVRLGPTYAGGPEEPESFAGYAYLFTEKDPSGTSKTQLIHDDAPQILFQRELTDIELSQKFPAIMGTFVTGPIEASVSRKFVDVPYLEGIYSDDQWEVFEECGELYRSDRKSLQLESFDLYNKKQIKGFSGLRTGLSAVAFTVFLLLGLFFSIYCVPVLVSSCFVKHSHRIIAIPDYGKPYLLLFVVPADQEGALKSAFVESLMSRQRDPKMKYLKHVCHALAKFDVEFEYIGKIRRYTDVFSEGFLTK